MNSVKFEALEKKALKIQRKKLFKTIFTSLFLVSIVVIAFIFLQQQNINKNNQKDFNLTTKTIEKKMQKKVVKQEIKKNDKPKVQKKEKLPKKVVKKEDTYDTLKLTPVIILDEVNNEKVQIAEEKIINKEEPKNKKINLIVKEVGSKSALEERFKVANDFDSAIRLAKIYFDENNYDRAILWAKRASKIEPKEDLSWILFAKANYKKGNKKDAIKALEVYSEYFRSKNVQQLLNKYRNER
ncbi:tetratricopeptide repeat protein [Sulfurospirillum sp. 1307]|jgi:tetratricopeptide (TPR) repeat protein